MFGGLRVRCWCWWVVAGVCCCFSVFRFAFNGGVLDVRIVVLLRGLPFEFSGGACGCCGLCSNLVRSSGVASGFLVF